MVLALSCGGGVVLAKAECVPVGVECGGGVGEHSRVVLLDEAGCESFHPCIVASPVQVVVVVAYRHLPDAVMVVWVVGHVDEAGDVPARVVEAAEFGGCLLVHDAFPSMSTRPVRMVMDSTANGENSDCKTSSLAAMSWRILAGLSFAGISRYDMTMPPSLLNWISGVSEQ